MDDNTTLIIAVCFGALMVGIHSWSRFDEPSYNTQSEYFARYEPKFATYHTLCQRAKWAYVGAVVAIYIILSLAPGVFTALSPSKSISGAEIPLAAALAIVTLQNFPGIKELEQQLRGFLHAIARIPDGVRRTVAQMRGSPFNVRAEMTSVRSVRCLEATSAHRPRKMKSIKLVPNNRFVAGSLRGKPSSERNRPAFL